MTSISKTPNSVSTAQSLDDDLRDLRIDGYDVKFVNRVVLLPVDLAAARDDGSASAVGDDGGARHG